MCKYCKMKTLNADVGEMSNNDKTIVLVKDGCQTFAVSLYRYKGGHSDEQINLLIAEELLDYGEGLVGVAYKEVSIKYCPFCGEEL